MQGLDWHVTGSYGVAKPCAEEEVFKMGGKLTVRVLVENEQELELVSGLAFLYGAESHAEIWDGTHITGMRTDYLLIYTTWDPFDPNRI